MLLPDELKQFLYYLNFTLLNPHYRHYDFNIVLDLIASIIHNPEVDWQGLDVLNQKLKKLETKDVKIKTLRQELVTLLDEILSF